MTRRSRLSRCAGGRWSLWRRHAALFVCLSRRSTGRRRRKFPAPPKGWPCWCRALLGCSFGRSSCPRWALGCSRTCRCRSRRCSRIGGLWRCPGRRRTSRSCGRSCRFARSGAAGSAPGWRRRGRSWIRPRRCGAAAGPVGVPVAGGGRFPSPCAVGGHRLYHGAGGVVRHHSGKGHKAMPQGASRMGGVEPHPADNIINLPAHPDDGRHKNQPGEDPQAAGHRAHGGEEQL